MEWVETTGRTIDDAKEAALDELGVDAQDAEFEILEEPKLGLFGRIRNEGRVRARVRPVSPPSKDERRRRGRKPSEAPKDAGGTTASAGVAQDAGTDPIDGSSVQEKATRAAVPAESSSRGAVRAKGPNRNGDRGRGASGASQTPRPGSAARQNSRGSTQGDDDMEVSLEDQGRAAEEFLVGLLNEFGVTAEITTSQPDTDTLEFALTGADLGTLIGPKGATLLAIQDLTRTVVQRKTGAGNGRIRVDVNGYRQKRSEALSRFAQEVAEQVKSSGVRKALEPMSAQDRKVVHDALTDVDGVSTVSEGEDAARRVVILPQGD